MDVIREDNHPDLDAQWTDPAELAWHLYRHHGHDINTLSGLDSATLWDLHSGEHESS